MSPLATGAGSRRNSATSEPVLAEPREPLALGLADRDQLLSDRPHVLDQPPALAPDRLGTPGELAGADLGRLAHLVGIPAGGGESSPRWFVA